ncbi:MAG: hypothetical protein SH850_29955 [Planctomycetaceae bacterium]|nr:hypothetical protein [Planctomycetaceae bacterium]
MSSKPAPNSSDPAEIPLGHIPLDFDRVIDGLLKIDAKQLPRTAAAAKAADKKRATAKASAKKKPAK